MLTPVPAFFLTVKCSCWAQPAMSLSAFYRDGGFAGLCRIFFNFYYCGAQSWANEAGKLPTSLREPVKQGFLYVGVKLACGSLSAHVFKAGLSALQTVLSVGNALSSTAPEHAFSSLDKM